MKKSMQVFLSFLIVSCILIGNALYVFPVLASDEIPNTEFEDIEFFNAVIAEVNIRLYNNDRTNSDCDDKLLYSEATSLKKLVADSKNISSIKGIKYFTGLTELNMNNNNIVDIEELCYLKKLETINLGNNLINSLNAIKDNILLTSIDFTHNNIVNIDELSFLINLKTINLGSNQITSINSIKDIISLTSINFSNNKIASIEELSFLINLKTINLGSNQITSLNAIKDIISLTSINFAYNKIVCIDELSFLINLKTINLGSNQITSINSISNITSLTSINFGGNQITSLNAIKNITLLTSINFAYNDISSIEDLSSLVNLKIIHLYHNNITSLDAISNLTSLTYIDLSINKITSLDSIRNLTSLTSINFSENKIISMENLNLLVNLKTVLLNNNKITMLFGFPNVSGATINLSYNWINFDSPLNIPIFNQISANNSINSSNQDSVLPTDNDEILNNMDGIVDVNLYIEARLQADINKDGKLTRGEARALHELDVQQRDIVSMKGIEFFTGLTRLDLSFNRISMIQGLDGRHNMYKIDLSHNRIDFGDADNISVRDALIDNGNLIFFDCQDPELPTDSDVILNDESGIPDTFFYNLVLSASNDGVILTKGKARRITALLGQYKGIYRIKGLEYLSGLITLDLSNNKISSLVGFETLVGCNIILNNNNIDIFNINNINIKNILMLEESKNTIDLSNQVILKYYINPINNFIHGVELNTTIELFDTEIKGAGIGSVEYSRTNIARGSTIVTGSKININVNGSSMELTVIVYGDLNGDGKIDLNDLVLIRDSLLEKSQLTDINKAAGDIYGEGRITLNDLLWVSDYISNK